MPDQTTPPEAQPQKVSALELAGRQRDISISEFFLKNRHLLGFDTPEKALVTAVKEAVDNAVDACEDAGILPEIKVELRRRGRIFTVAVEDNGPGILEEQIGRIFGKLLYGSKFHKLAQSRGQQGMGIAAAGMYGQLTTGKPLHILSRVEGEPLATDLYVAIDTQKNRPDVHRKKHLEWGHPQGTRVEIVLEGSLQGGRHSVGAYLRQTAIANPHITIHYQDPDGHTRDFFRSIHSLPPRPREIKPHPHGIELGRLIQMLNNTDSRTLMQFLVNDFSSVGRKTAARIIKAAGQRVSERSYPTHIAHTQAIALHRAIEKTPVLSPRTDCVVPIGEPQLLKGLQSEVAADFYTATTRPAGSYRGNPFQIEVAIAYGQAGEARVDVAEGGRMNEVRPEPVPAGEDLLGLKDEPAHLLRFANRVPLLYQQSGCAITRAAIQTNWRAYGLHQPKGALPIGPMAILVHLASVWVPYTSEAKEAIEPTPEIVKEIVLGLQHCGRELAQYLRRKARLRREYERRVYIETYLPHIGGALQDILALSDEERDNAMQRLDSALHESRQKQGGGHDGNA
ncbi:DNA topoisomerase VI subunit B [Roseibium aggregatum]|uniref:Type 2 DNA topoisomerase 6 subunit B n=1 Tax=Roseibium aggregatum TaxID=187304 RepID=A0A926NTG3_9HYPH|nr:DNA topoisomerase VI subunit B [Roseibium aggregatum]MBD1544904.1 DNA topoisomerase VI subunit B [Roseibium aggregatum]